MYKLKYLFLLLLLVFTACGCSRTTFRIVEPAQQLREEDASADFAEEIMLSLLAVRRNMNTGIILMMVHLLLLEMYLLFVMEVQMLQYKLSVTILILI